MTRPAKQSSISRAFALVSLTLIALSFVSRPVESKAIQLRENDPLIALASGALPAQAQHTRYYHTYRAPVDHQAYEPKEQAVVYTTEQLSSEPKQESYYVIESNGHGVHDANYKTQHRQEYISLEPSQSPVVGRVEYENGRDQPGEVVYIDPNSEAQIQTSVEYQGAASDSHTSGLAATILTEIPIKDMPIHVLEKLKKDYGVKVVATREHPGASLVINCNDYAGDTESSICNKPVAPNYFQPLDLVNIYNHSQQRPQQHQTYTLTSLNNYEAPNVDERSVQDQSQDQAGRIASRTEGATVYEHSNYEQEQPGQPETLSNSYPTRNGDGHSAELTPADHEADNGYGSKINSTQDELNVQTDTQTKPDEQGGLINTTVSYTDTARAQPESESHQQGFDDQSSTGAYDDSKQASTEQSDRQ